MVLRASEVIDLVREDLHDEDSTSYRWSDVKVLAKLSLAQELIVSLKPGANPTWATIKLNPKHTSQRGVMPEDAGRLIRVERNMSSISDEAVPGSSITSSSKELLDRANRTAHQDFGEGEIECWAPDPDDPLNFYISPSAGSNSFVEILYAKIPDALEGDVLSDIELEVRIENKLPLSYLTQALILSGDDPAGELQRADRLYALAYQSMGLSIRALAAILPKTRETEARSPTQSEG